MKRRMIKEMHKRPHREHKGLKKERNRGNVISNVDNCTLLIQHC